jgi:hypothetical protein
MSAAVLQRAAGLAFLETTAAGGSAGAVER